jgi:hypothetical protein
MRLLASTSRGLSAPVGDHGAGGPDPVGQSDIAIMSSFGTTMADTADKAALSTPGIYGGTDHVFRNMIAQHALGLGRPNYSLPK